MKNNKYIYIYIYYIYIYIYIYIRKINKVRYCHTFSVYLLDFYRGFTAFTDFQADINVNIHVVTMRNDVTSGVTSGVSNVTLKLLKNGIITKSGQ